jgi:hypothetical protein
LGRVVKGSFPEDGVVGAFVEVNDDPVWLDFDRASRFHEFAVELFWRGGVKGVSHLTNADFA